MLRQAEIEYIGGVPCNRQVAVKIEKIGPPRPWAMQALLPCCVGRSANSG